MTDRLLGAGARVGHYEILSLLGRGGMGEVYRARDTRLNRDVAIKVLPDGSSADPQRASRFQREAEILAALTHQNVATIYGIEFGPPAGVGQPGATAIVMELVEGPTLADRLGQGALSVEEALPIARQIVDAIDYAHEKGVLHRDLKPSNIKITPEGQVKVLDFGLAKALDRAELANDRSPLAASPTLSPVLTSVGTVIGTPGYMSPEQVRGQALDKRADVWAFGCVLYEMLAGMRPFSGETTSDTLAAVLTNQPNWTALPAATPAIIRRLVQRCLQKDPKRRLPDIAVARLDIDDALTASTPDSAVGTASHAGAPHARWRWLVPFVAGVGLAAAAVSAAWVALRPTPLSSPVTRFGITLPPEQPLAISFNDRDLDISPDGTRLVYTAGADAQLIVRALDRLEPVSLAGITNARAPFVSPDGRWVGYFDRLDEGLNTGPVVTGALRKAPIAGGPPIVLATITGASRGASWGPDDSIVFATSDLATGLLRVPARGGEPEVLTRSDVNSGEEDHHYPALLPGGRGVLFTVASRNPIERRVAVLDLRTEQWKTLIRSGSQPRYVETGHLIYEDGGALWAVGFDESTLDIVGDPVLVLEGVTRQNTATNFGMSRHGTLVYAASGAPGTARSLVWVDRQGNEDPIAAPQRSYFQPRLSPDETRIAVRVQGRAAGFGIWDLSFGTLTARSFGRTGPFFVWSRNSQYLIVDSGPGNDFTGLSRHRADGTGVGEPLTTPGLHQRPMDVSPDGKLLVFEQQTPALSFDLMTLPLDDPAISTGAGARTSPLLDSPADERNASIAPDGRWVAYESNKSGQFQVYVKPFPNVADAEHQISTGGGRTPVWSPNGRELFFVSGSALMAIAVQTTPAFRAGNPTKLFEAQARILDGRLLGNSGRPFDVSRNGQRFLMLKDTAAADRMSRPGIVVVQNWFQELQATVKAR